MIVKAEVVLHDFYTQYLAWTAAGAHQDAPFNQRAGLCSNFNDFLHRKYSHVDHHYRAILRAKLQQQFIDAGLHHNYPFNPGGEEEYDGEFDMQAMHMNPRRLAWVVAEVQRGFSSAAA